METWHFPLDSFWKQSYEGYPTLGLDVHLALAFPNPYEFRLSLGQLYETWLNKWVGLILRGDLDHLIILLTRGHFLA